MWCLSRERGRPALPPCGGRLARLNNGGPPAGCSFAASGPGGRDARAPRKCRSAWALSWERGYLARLNTRVGLRTPVGLRPTCGRDARAPRKCRSAWALSWERGYLARLNTRVGLRTPVGLRPTCGRDARAPRKCRSAWALSWERGHLARLDTRVGLRTPVGLRPTCGWDARAPRDASRRAWLNCKDDGASRIPAAWRGQGGTEGRRPENFSAPCKGALKFSGGAIGPAPLAIPSAG